MGVGKLSTKELVEQLKETPFKLIGSYKGSQVPIKIKSMECGHTFEMLLRNVRRKISKNQFCCIKCEQQKQIDNQKLDKDYVFNYIYKNTQKEYKLVNKEDYVNNRSKILVFHKNCGETYETRFTNFQEGKRCPICAKKSKESNMAQLLKQLLKQIGIKYEEEKKFEDCKNPFTDNFLRFDIYLPELNTLIEIDGEQHFIPIKRFGGRKTLIDTQHRDHLKNKYAFQNGIELIRLSLYDVILKRKKQDITLKLEVFNLIEELVERTNSTLSL